MKDERRSEKEKGEKRRGKGKAQDGTTKCGGWKNHVDR